MPEVASSSLGLRERLFPFVLLEMVIAPVVDRCRRRGPCAKVNLSRVLSIVGDSLCLTFYPRNRFWGPRGVDDRKGESNGMKDKMKRGSTLPMLQTAW